MIEYFAHLTLLEIALLWFVSGYGIVLGINNTFVRIYSLFTIRSLQQNLYGQLLDAAYYGSIAALVLLHINGG